MEPERMDVDVPNAGAGVPATPPQSNNNTPQRNAAAGGSRGERRQADSAVPESPLRQAVVAEGEGDSEEEELLPSSSSAAFPDTARTVGIRSQRSAGKLRSRGRGAELGVYEGDGEGQGGVEHSDFFNDFGQDWDRPE
ncbi:hypothetical protein IWW48_000929 [Coemansia sp. RSA 1200]|nr:hypothetical protein IWW48_000929 [Coemansia sp. RSA 1200]